MEAHAKTEHLQPYLKEIEKVKYLLKSNENKEVWNVDKNSKRNRIY